MIFYGGLMQIQTDEDRRKEPNLIQWALVTGVIAVVLAIPWRTIWSFIFG
jgi:hypothetical protein